MVNSVKKARLAGDFENWWAHRLERPIIQVSLGNSKNNDSGDFFGSDYRKKILSACYDFNLPVSQAVKEIERAYGEVEFLGDAFPVFYMRSTGVLGAYLGQKFGINREQGTVWLGKMDMDLARIAKIEIDMQNPLLLRSLELTRAIQDCFEGNVAVGVPDLGGVFDILASIYDPNELLPDLCEAEDEVEAAAWQIYRQLERAIRLFGEVIDPDRILGYTCWATMLSQKPYYVIQNDFSAMISAEMYNEYYLPILREESRVVPRTFYHLDGPGAVRHLDAILTVRDLAGVQWVNGAGAAGLDQWPEIYRKIFAAGKLCQVFINSADELGYIDAIADIVGTTKGLCFICTGDSGDADRFERYLSKYGVI